jgi:hypothetical protein
MSNAARIALIGGQGWPLTETAAGLPTLQQRLSAQGVEVQTFSHDARQARSTIGCTATVVFARSSARMHHRVDHSSFGAFASD